MSSISRSELGLLVLLCGLAAAPLPARAAPAAALDTNRATALAVQAGKAFRAGKFDESARLFLEAYRLSLRPAQLRNAARAFEEGGLLDEAATHWTRYRDHEGLTADERAEANAHVLLIAERKRSAAMLEVAEAARAAAEVASAAAEAARQQVDASRAAEARRAAELTAAGPPPARGPPALAYGLAGTGGAAAITGAVLWFVAAGRLSDVDAQLAERDGADRITGITPTELSSEVSGINTTRVVSGVLLSAGLAAAASGVLWLILDDGAGGEPGGPRLSMAHAPSPLDGNAN